MEIIHANFKTIDYPVGDNIQNNISIINKMGIMIKSILIEKKLEIDNQINLICSGVTMRRIFNKIPENIIIDIIAISKIENENIINFFEEKKVKILLRN